MIPILSAVPRTILIALFKFFVFKSGSLIFAISSNCNSFIEPTVPLLGVAAPFLIFAALIKRIDAGGVFNINE